MNAYEKSYALNFDEIVKKSLSLVISSKARNL